MARIDAPEKGQAFGTKARENLATKVFGKTVRVEFVDIDRYRREVGRIYLGDRFITWRWSATALLELSAREFGDWWRRLGLSDFYVLLRLFDSRGRLSRIARLLVIR